MVTPSKQEILELATRLYFKDNQDAPTPEEDELAESGYYYEAQNQLMRNDTSFRTYLEQQAAQNGYRLVTEAEHDRVLEFERAKEQLRKKKNRIKQLEEKLESTRSEKHEEPKVQPQELFDIKEALNTGIFISGTSGSGKSNLAYHIADKLMQKGVIVFVIDPSQAWSRYSSVPNVLRIDYPKRGKKDITYQDGHVSVSTVFDVSFLTYPQRRDFTEQFCKALLNTRKNSEHRPRTVVFFEESQLYFYEGSMRSPKKYGNSIELITNGRNFNLRYAAITQFPSNIDKLLIKMTKQRFFAWTNEPNDLDYIKDIIGHRMAEKLPQLEVGEFVYSYPVRNGCTKAIKVQKFQR